MRRANKLAGAGLIFASVMVAAICQAEVPGTVSPTERVVDAMARAGVVVGARQVEFLAGAGSLRENAHVRVVSVTSGVSDTVRVKMRCRNNHECLPFYVLVHEFVGAKPDRFGAAAALERATASAKDKDVVRSGDHAILVLETADARMSFPVICLQSGMRGQRVRAASPDRRQFYEAEVVAPGMLRGNL